ncbi:MAG: Uncharacterized conserved protein, DUF1501 family [Verrucomicrobia bacterium]|nr:MAG: Uncharacterized conserved protein, DUF1501 family [Verrucomicrobiota bacterium]
MTEMSRRAFAERLAKCAFGLTVLPSGVGRSAGGEKLPGFGSAKSVIMLTLSGGMSHLDTFDPKEGPSQGPKKGMGTSAGFQVSEYLPETAKVARHLCVVRSMTAKVGVHEQARYLMRTGFEKRGTVVHPMLGSWAHHYLGASHETLPSTVCVNRNSGSGNGFFPATMAPLPVLDPAEGLRNVVPGATGERQEARLALLGEMDRGFEGKVKDGSVKAYTEFYESTMQLMKGKDLAAFDLAKEGAAEREAYGAGRFAQGCLLARRLVEHGVRFVEVESGGWDMHRDLEGGMEDEGAQFDRAFAALVSDLERRGLLATTLVVVATEFGRKPEFEGGGRGHHPGVFSWVLAGAGMKRGYVHGASDKRGASPESGAVTVGDLHATIGHALGCAVDEPVTAAGGRPFTVGNKGKPVLGMFA